MATAVVSAKSTRPNGLLTVSEIPGITITLVATAYATASGGVAFDIATVLNQAGPYDSGINPSDIIGAGGFTLNGFLVQNFVVGTPTYNTSADTSFRANLSLATCPCTCKLFGTGSANHAALGEIADGNLTDTITLTLRVSRSGAN